MRDVVVLGAYATEFGQFVDRDVRMLGAEATKGALSDAGLAGSDLGFVAFSNAVAGSLTGQEMILGQLTMLDAGVEDVPLVNVENACASGSSAFHLARMAIASGQCDVAMAVGAEKMWFEDRRGHNALSGGADLRLLEQRPATAGPLAMTGYAAEAGRYLSRTGAPKTLLAEVAAKNRYHGSLNPRAFQRQPVTPEQVLDSRLIAEPLHLLMCCPVNDGAAALVLCSAEYAANLGRDGVAVLASVMGSGRRDRNDVVPRTAAAAYELARLAPTDIDVAEIHDGAASAEPIVLEELGLAPEDKAWSVILDGETRVGGRLPVNPGGGLIARGHPIGATGCAQLVELVEQLRGTAGERQVTGARFGLAENAGGAVSTEPLIAASCTITILGTERP